MTKNLCHKFLICCLLLIIGSSIYAQARSKTSKTQLFAELAADEKAVAECEKSAREYQLKTYGRLLPKIAGHCFGGCPVIMPKPWYPDVARRNKISGEVRVETIVDKNGEVVFAKILKGNAIFRQSALAAARSSRYQPKITCGNRPIKFRWILKYIFYPGM